MAVALIPAKGTSFRIPLKNLEQVGERTLLQWAIGKAKRWLPLGTEIYVASEHPEIQRAARNCGCNHYPLTEDDVFDRRNASLLFDEFLARVPERPAVMLDCCAPFWFRSELQAAISDPRPLIRPVLDKTLHLTKFQEELSQDIPSTVAYLSPFLVVNREGVAPNADWYDPQYFLPVTWISAIGINTPEDLRMARWLGRFVTLDDLDDLDV